MFAAQTLFASKPGPGITYTIHIHLLADGHRTKKIEILYTDRELVSRFRALRKKLVSKKRLIQHYIRRLPYLTKNDKLVTSSLKARRNKTVLKFVFRTRKPAPISNNLTFWIESFPDPVRGQPVKSKIYFPGYLGYFPAVYNLNITSDIKYDYLYRPQNYKSENRFFVLSFTTTAREETNRVLLSMKVETLRKKAFHTMESLDATARHELDRFRLHKGQFLFMRNRIRDRGLKIPFLPLIAIGTLDLSFITKNSSRYPYLNFFNPVLTLSIRYPGKFFFFDPVKFGTSLFGRTYSTGSPDRTTTFSYLKLYAAPGFRYEFPASLIYYGSYEIQLLIQAGYRYTDVRSPEPSEKLYSRGFLTGFEFRSGINFDGFKFGLGYRFDAVFANPVEYWQEVFVSFLF